MPSVSQKGDTQSLTGLHPGAPWQLCTGPAETCAGSHPRSHREGGCGPKGPFSLRGVSGCVFSIAPLGPYLNTLSVTFYSQNGHFESIFHHKYADDRKFHKIDPQNSSIKIPRQSRGIFIIEQNTHSAQPAAHRRGWQQSSIRPADSRCRVHAGGRHRTAQWCCPG